ncbi:tyrosine-type recombinase/integrase [Rhizobium sp. BK376]|uniref:tyrosine-type recombinase/integrase n=1 Tax=Rhizobium sp. BK376 TaxID=2512149 RepID=UPI001405057E|nr:tyrosine-type recombinase/integrase [Rhizobium sp. BK376]
MDAAHHRLRNRARSEHSNLGKTFDHAKAFIFDAMARWHGAGSLSPIRRALDELETHYREADVDAVEKDMKIRALPEIVVRELGEIFNPLSPRNPFRTASLRWRNFLLFLLLLTLGIRRGESALMTTASVYSEFDIRLGRMVYFANIMETHEADQRSEAPSLKTEASLRQIPIAKSLVRILSVYEVEHRPVSHTPFLLLSQKKKPLSVRQINSVFESATAGFSDEAIAALARQRREAVTPHDLRHTCAVMRLKRHVDGQGLSLALAHQRLREFFGWDPDSEMPAHYSRAYSQPKAAEAWDFALDATLDVLRHLGIDPEEL